jgi:hypothetical protein
VAAASLSTRASTDWNFNREQEGAPDVAIALPLRLKRLVVEAPLPIAGAGRAALILSWTIAYTRSHLGVRGCVRSSHSKRLRLLHKHPLPGQRQPHPPHYRTSRGPHVFPTKQQSAQQQATVEMSCFE